ncbi:MAG: PKD domain-containing protein, partial [Phycisphaerae bacterium]
DPGACGPGTQQCVEFDSSDGTRYLAVYARSSIGRYSFGVKADSGGAVVDSGTLPPGVRNELSIPGPSLTISVTPLEGTSPLTVRFKGNASSELEINDDLTEWDFDVDDDDPATKSSGRNATYTYVVPDGESRVFTARLTVYDVGPVEPFREGNPAMAEARIKVSGQASDALGNIETGGDVRITINPTGRLASEPEELELCETIESGGVCGVSPFEVQLKLQGDPPDGTRQTVFWDLGDGSTATSLSVTHTYTNRTGMPEGLVISATVRTETSGGVIVETRASARITVLPGSAEEEIPDVVLPGTTPQGGRPSTSLCGAAGILPLFLTMLLLVCLRRWH